MREQSSQRDDALEAQLKQLTARLNEVRERGGARLDPRNALDFIAGRSLLRVATDRTSIRTGLPHAQPNFFHLLEIEWFAIQTFEVFRLSI